MKRILIPIVGGLTALLPLHGETLNLDLSPAGTSPAVGLSPANVTPPASGTGSGGEVYGGITYDTDSNVLSVALAYGSFFGFTDLTGEATLAHIHGPAPVGSNAGVVHDFIGSGQHLPAPDPATGGTIIGTVALSDTQETELLDGLYYVNIHTADNGGGELRAQLIVVLNTPPTVICPESSIVECASPDGTPVELTATVEDLDGDELTVVWTVDGADEPPVVVPSGGDSTLADVMFSHTFGIGPHDVSVSVSDGTADPVSCEFTITVVDTTAPVINEITASPSALWPPNHKMRTVEVTVDAEDVCGEVTSKVIEVSSNEPVNDIGDGNTESDWEILGDLEVDLRAERAGPFNGRVYTLTVEVTDQAGNATIGTTEVTVGHSLGRGNAFRRFFRLR